MRGWQGVRLLRVVCPAPGYHGQRSVAAGALARRNYFPAPRGTSWETATRVVRAAPCVLLVDPRLSVSVLDRLGARRPGLRKASRSRRAWAGQR